MAAGEPLKTVLDAVKRRAKYFEDWRLYAEEICRLARERFGQVRVIVFGSVVRGDYDVLNSDIDILVVAENAPQDPWEAARFRIQVRDHLGDPAAPFEIHLATPEQYEGWYRRFIDEQVEVCSNTG